MSKRKTHEEYVVEVAKMHPNIEVIGTYIDAKTHILHRCKIDDCEWYAKPNNILNGKGCPRCSKKERRTHERYVVEVANINPDIEVVGKYVNARTPILHRCKIDGYEWTAAPFSILQGHGCSMCTGNRKYKHEEYVERIVEIDSNIEVVGEYIDSLTPILHKCKIDGCEWMARPSAILYGCGCPKCNISKGEKIVANWLDEYNILYEYQKMFDDCKNIHSLSFDFYLPKYNICIEYNGKQHYEPVDYFGGQKTFEKQVLRDNIKREYCKNNNIGLLEIPYYKNIDEELNKIYDLIMDGRMLRKGWLHES